jgi:hypothetical protein
MMIEGALARGIDGAGPVAAVFHASSRSDSRSHMVTRVIRRKVR